MKKTIRSAFALVLVFALLVSALGMSVFAEEPTSTKCPAYPHMGVEPVVLLKAPEVGSKIAIPVVLHGLNAGQYLSGFSCNLNVKGGLAIDDENPFTKAGAVQGFYGGYNSTNRELNLVSIAASEDPSQAVNADSILFYVNCVVTGEIVDESGVQITNISMSQTNDICLNTSDANQSHDNLDSNAITYPLDEDGNVTFGVYVQEPEEYTLTVAADKAEAQVDDIVNVTVTVNGGAFAGYQYYLTYNPAYFELVSNTAGVSAENGVFHDWNVCQNGTEWPDNTVVNTYTFKVLAQTENVTGTFALSRGMVDNFMDSVSGASQFCLLSDPAEVSITLKTGLTVEAEDIAPEFDNKPHSVTPVAKVDGVEDPTAEIKFMDENGKYTLDECPTFTEIGEYEVKFQATKPGFEPAYGSATITVTAPKYQIETVEYTTGSTLVLVYTDYSVMNYAYDGNTMLDISASGYELNGVPYQHVYGWVTAGPADETKITYVENTPTKVVYSTDVNNSKTVDLRDVIAVNAVYNNNSLYLSPVNMALALRADVDRSKTISVADWGAVLVDPNYVK